MVRETKYRRVLKEHTTYNIYLHRRGDQDTKKDKSMDLHHKIVVSSDGKYQYGYVNLELWLSAGKTGPRYKQLDDRFVRNSELERKKRVECTLEDWLRKQV